MQNVIGCTFNVAITSQKTALENQVMGTYHDIEKELFLNMLVRGKGDFTVETRRDFAIQNQAFNRDDLDELKSKAVIGESITGKLQLLGVGSGRAKNIDKKDLNLSKLLIAEENDDRHAIWLDIIRRNNSLSRKDMKSVQVTYAKLMNEKSKVGHWIEVEVGKWRQKN